MNLIVEHYGGIESFKYSTHTESIIKDTKINDDLIRQVLTEDHINQLIRDREVDILESIEAPITEDLINIDDWTDLIFCIYDKFVNDKLDDLDNVNSESLLDSVQGDIYHLVDMIRLNILEDLQLNY